MGYGNTEVFLSERERENLIQSLMGTVVDIVIDRPIGYVHVTKGITLHYPVNYGYLPGIAGGDGEEQDVYILGVSEPLTHFRGRIVGVIRREDDNEDKLIAAPEGVIISRERIQQETYFAERYFDSYPESMFEPGKKIVLLSFDDGTEQDGRLVELLNRYHIPATFNLNTGLEDFVWEYEGKPVRRQHLADTVKQYRGHEIASHSLHHYRLDTLPPPQLRREVEEDCIALRQIFPVEELGFAVPFTVCGEREIRIIRKFVRYIRLSEFADSFALPENPYHIPIHGLFSQPDIRQRIAEFAANTMPVSVFVMAGHSYELDMLDTWEYMEELLQYMKTFDFTFMTTMDYVNTYYPKQ